MTLAIKIMEGSVCVFLILLTSAYAPPHEHHHPGEPPCPGPECVDKLFETLNVHLDEALCRDIEHIRCEDHVLLHDEIICGSDLKTYPNHCEFVKERCKIIREHHHNHIDDLTPLYIGACGHAITTPSTTPSPAPTTRPTVTLAPASATPPQVYTATTAVSLNNVLGNVFCTHKDSINCVTTLIVVCGTDGKYYPNICELLKEECNNPNLREAPDASACSANGK